MTTWKHDGRPARRRCQGDEGAGLVEFALIAVLLLTLLFGIINFGLILSFRQDVTRAAAEGARGGAVAVPADAADVATAQAAALAATQEAMKEVGGRFDAIGCDGAGTNGMTCTAVIANCTGQPGFKCVTVKLSYDYDEEPIYGDLPLMSAFLPDKIEATSVARINA